MAQFISEATLKEGSVLQDNVDMKVVTPTIVDVQNMYILPILGTALYNELSSRITTGTLTPDYKNLLDLFITPVMLWYIRLELPMAINYKFFNKAVGVQNADNMTPLTESEMGNLNDHNRNKAQWYAERLTKFLMANSTTFPLYLNQPNAGIDTIFPKRNNWNSGMFLDDAGCCKGEYNFQNIPIAKSERMINCDNC